MNHNASQEKKWNPYLTKHCAFVLSLFDTGLATLRHLHAHGVEVFAFDYNINAIGFFTHLAKTELAPSPLTSADLLLDFLLEKSKKLKFKPVLYSASDAYVKFVSDYREQLSPFFLFNLPDKSVTDHFLSKDSQAQWARKAGAITPHEIQVDFGNFVDDVDCEDIFHNKSLNFPVFIKGMQSFLWQKHFSVKGFVAKNFSEYVKILTKINSFDLAGLVQEIIPGSANQNYEISYYISTHGEKFGPFIMRKIRQYPSDFGVATLGESIHFESLKNQADALIEKMQIRGFANMELKWDIRDQQFKYIETNLRVWQQVDLCRACGWDFVWIQYLDLTEQKLDQYILQADYKEGFRWLDPWNDLYSFLEQWGRGQLKFKEWLCTLKNIKVFGIFSFEDPKPFCRIKYLLSHFLIGIRYFLLQVKKLMGY